MINLQIFSPIRFHWILFQALIFALPISVIVYIHSSSSRVALYGLYFEAKLENYPLIDVGNDHDT